MKEEREDFDKGFVINKDSKKDKKTNLLRHYEIKEVKKADQCIYCKGTMIKQPRKNYSSIKNVYAVVNDEFALCRLYRWEYLCASCGLFLNMEEPRQYGRSDMFSQNFVEKALLEWLSNGTLSLRATAQKIGINHASLSEWFRILVDIFEPIKPKLCRPLSFVSFIDKDKIRRGLICQLDQVTNGSTVKEEIKVKAFLKYYDPIWISQYLKSIEQGMFREIPEVYFDYAPGLSDILSGFFPAAKVGMNLNNLHNQICSHLGTFSTDSAQKYKGQLSSILFPINTNDSYALSQMPEKLKKKIQELPVYEQNEFVSLLNSPERYLTNSFTMELAERKYNTDNIREKIMKMTGNHHTYESIAVKLCYDANNEDYKAIYDSMVTKVALDAGKRFEYMFPDETFELADGEAVSDYTYNKSY